jgi:hypothetical protein
MAGLVPAIGVFVSHEEDLDARDKPAHDEHGNEMRFQRNR